MRPARPSCGGILKLTVLAAVGVVAGFDDVTVMGDTIQHGGVPLGIAKDLHPF